MMDDTAPADSFDVDDEIKRLHESSLRLYEARIELQRTLHALRANRRTPRQIQGVINRAKQALYRSMLLKERRRMRRIQAPLAPTCASG